MTADIAWDAVRVFAGPLRVPASWCNRNRLDTAARLDTLTPRGRLRWPLKYSMTDDNVSGHPITSHMVADPTDVASGRLINPYRPLHATTPLHANLAYPLQPWAPRTERTAAFIKWRSTVTDLLAAFGADISPFELVFALIDS